MSRSWLGKDADGVGFDLGHDDTTTMVGRTTADGCDEQVGISGIPRGCRRVLNWGSRFYICSGTAASTTTAHQTPQTRAKGYWHKEQPASASLAASERPRHLVRIRTDRTVAKITSASSIACQLRLRTACCPTLPTESSWSCPAANLHHHCGSSHVSAQRPKSRPRSIDKCCGTAAATMGGYQDTRTRLFTSISRISQTVFDANIVNTIIQKFFRLHRMRKTLHKAHRANDSNRNGPTSC